MGDVTIKASMTLDSPSRRTLSRNYTKTQATEEFDLSTQTITTGNNTINVGAQITTAYARQTHTQGISSENTIAAKFTEKVIRTN